MSAKIITIVWSVSLMGILSKGRDFFFCSVVLTDGVPNQFFLRFIVINIKLQ